MPPSKEVAPRFRNIDRTDRELLGVIEDVAGDVGASAAEIARALGVSVNGNKHQTPGKVVGSRLGAMRRIGLIDRRAETATADGDSGFPFTLNLWFLTDKGRLILTGRLNKSTESALGRLSPGQQLLALQRIAREGYINGDETTALTLRRQMTHDIAQRRIPWRTR